MSDQYNYVMERLNEGLHLLPPHMRDGITLYVDKGLPHIGHFLRALLSNDFMGAMGRADDENIAALKQWAIFLHNYVPSGCYGSPERVRAWVKAGGASGLYGTVEGASEAVL